MYDIIPIIQDKFKSLVLTKREVENVKEYLRQQEIIKHYYDGKTNHRGINECYLALFRRYYWPKMRDVITKFINSCTVCGQAKYDRHPINQQFRIVPPASRPFETVHIDLLTIQTEKYLNIENLFSKFAQAYHIRDGTAVSIVQALLKFCTHHGLPLTIVSYNETEFTSQMFSEFINMHKITHHKTLPHAPNDNGIMERFHSTLLEHLRILKLTHKGEGKINLVPYGILAYNSAIHIFTKCRPIDIITGHFDPRDPFEVDLSYHLMQQYPQNHRDKMKLVHDVIRESSLADRTNIIENRNKSREPKVEYQSQQRVFVKIP